MNSVTHHRPSAPASASTGIHLANKARNVTSWLLTLVKNWPLRCVRQHAKWEFRFGVTRLPRSKYPCCAIGWRRSQGLSVMEILLACVGLCMTLVKGFGQPAAVELPTV